MNDIIRHIMVRGRVQGVGYRAFVADEAARRSLAAGCATAATARWRRCSADRRRRSAR